MTPAQKPKQTTNYLFTPVYPNTPPCPNPPPYLTSLYPNTHLPPPPPHRSSVVFIFILRKDDSKDFGDRWASTNCARLSLPSSTGPMANSHLARPQTVDPQPRTRALYNNMLLDWIHSTWKTQAHGCMGGVGGLGLWSQTTKTFEHSSKAIQDLKPDRLTTSCSAARPALLSLAQPCPVPPSPVHPA